MEYMHIYIIKINVKTIIIGISMQYATINIHGKGV